MNELAPYSMRVTFPSARDDSALLIEPIIHAEESLNLRDYWWVITSHLRLIILFFCGTLLTTGLVLVIMPTTYTAEVTLLIERKPPRILDINEAAGESLVPDEYDFYKTQFELLKSRTLAAQVIRELGLNPIVLQQNSNWGFLHRVPTARQ